MTDKPTSLVERLELAAAMTAVSPAWLRNDLAEAAKMLRDQESQRRIACGLCRPGNPCWWHREA